MRAFNRFDLMDPQRMTCRECKDELILKNEQNYGDKGLGTGKEREKAIQAELTGPQAD